MPRRLDLAAASGRQRARRAVAEGPGRALKAWSWVNLRLASAGQEWLRRHFTPAGRGVLAATFAAGLIGVDTRLSAAHQLFAFGAALLGVAWIGTFAPMPKIRLRRRLPTRAAVGEAVRYRARVHNAGRRLATGLTLHERTPDPRPSLGTFLDTRAPVEARLNPLERLLGYPRWEWLVRSASGTEPEAPTPMPSLAAGAELEVELHLTPTRRGWLHLDALVLGRIDPLGLLRREWVVADGGRILVLPRRYPVPRLRPAGRRRLQPGGVELAASRGDSREYMGLRDYLPGDSPRHIHWAAWARCGEPVVKEYRDEYFSRQALLLDTCPAPGDDPARFETAVSVAASLLAPLAEHPNGPDGLLDLILYADGVRVLTAGRGLSSTGAMLELLACVEPQPAAGLAHLADTVTARAPQQSACLCVLLGWDAARRQLVERLRRGGLPVTTLAIAGANAPWTASGDLIPVDPDNPALALARLR